ncbi:MAG: hypothetical protein A3H28_02280 [Acidobacteria bacterium RIFCSPLOWO2_02_FULL_61_28]|nr:MAG: hypothetical protein A3H28_02280 [Acidobacteria bacterium RIFCSPLOWO2_02_FULL_61_28]
MVSMAINIAIQLSGYQNSTLAALLWALTAILTIWWLLTHEKVKQYRKRFAETHPSAFLGLAGMAGGLLGALLLALGLIVVWETQPKMEAVQFPTGEYITKKWGTSGNDAVLILDTRELYRAAEEYRLMLVVLPFDPTVDSRTDNRIDKTGLFNINQEETKLQVTMSSATLVRLVPSGTLQFFGLIVPNIFDPTSFHSVQDAISRGARVIADPMSTVLVNRHHNRD